jgi:hypothetical protein
MMLLITRSPAAKLARDESEQDDCWPGHPGSRICGVSLCTCLSSLAQHTILARNSWALFSAGKGIIVCAHTVRE